MVDRGEVPLRSLDRVPAHPPRWQMAALCLGLVAVISAAESSTFDKHFAPYSLVPVILGAWHVGRSLGLAVAAVSSGASVASGWPQLQAAAFVWEIGCFVAVALFVSRLKEQRASDSAARSLLEAIIDAVPTRVFWKDRSPVYLGCKAAFARDARSTEPKDEIGKNDYGMGWRELAEVYRPDERRVTESGCSRLSIEASQTTPEGNRISLLTSQAPLRGPAGEIDAVLGMHTDVSERQRATQALRASELRYRRLFESAKDGILILDAETGTVVDVNPSLIELLGISREGFLGRKVWDLGFFEDILANRDSLAQLRQKKYVRYEDGALRASDGRRIEVEFVSNVYLVDHEDVIQCNIRDISARVRAQESQARLSTAVEQSAESIVITDTGGAIVYVNPAFERSTGYTRDQAIGQNPRILKSGRHDADFYHQLWGALARGAVWSGRITNRKKDGTLLEEDTTISAVRNASGEIVNYVAASRDVTHETRLQQRLLQAQKMEAIGVLAGGVAHDFNNMLGVITGYGEIVHRRMADEDPLKAKVAQILKAAERAADLTRQLLAFGRKQVLQPRILDLNAVVSGMQEMLPRSTGKDIGLVTVLEPHLGSVRADPGQVDQILANLAANACDAMPEGGRITIETRNVDLDESDAATHGLVQIGPHVMLAFSDTGSGMDAATQLRVFEPFFTTKGVGGGTGLGLSTVYGIVTQSGGYVWVDSEIGVGTTIKIYLPRVDGEAPAARRGARGPTSWGAETVLLVEDEAALREMLREILAANGYSVLVARDGAEALQLSAAHVGTIQLMLTDVIMPGATGPMIVDLVAQKRPSMKVLFMSGYSDEAVTRHGLIGPGRAFLSKPFGTEVLLRRVRESLDAA